LERRESEKISASYVIRWNYEGDLDR
jgi:hypothetical protein